MLEVLSVLFRHVAELTVTPVVEVLAVLEGVAPTTGLVTVKTTVEICAEVDGVKSYSKVISEELATL